MARWGTKRVGAGEVMKGLIIRWGESGDRETAAIRKRAKNKTKAKRETRGALAEGGVDPPRHKNCHRAPFSWHGRITARSSQVGLNTLCKRNFGDRSGWEVGSGEKPKPPH